MNVENILLRLLLCHHYHHSHRSHRARGSSSLRQVLEQGGEKVKPKQPVVTKPVQPEEPVVQPKEPTTPEPIDTLPLSR